jgi:multidrug resistance protein, MATE family
MPLPVSPRRNGRCAGLTSVGHNAGLSRDLSDPAVRRLNSPAVRAETAALWAIAWPILIGQLATVGMGVVDVAMAGHASAQDLAGVSLGVSIWHLAIITLMGVLMAVNPIVAQHVGARSVGQIPHVVRQALWNGLGLGLLAMVVVNLAALVFNSMDIEPQVRAVARQFVLVISLALPAFCCYRVLYGYSASLNQTKPMMLIALLALLLNIVVNYVLVFGNWGFPRLGGVGCAWATLLCVWFDLAAMVWWIRRAAAYRDTQPLTAYEPPDGAQIRVLLRIGLPIGVTYFAESSAFSLIALLVAGFGTAQVAGHQIALNFSSLVFMVPMSMGLALLTRVGQALGARDMHAARFRAWHGVGLSFAAAMVSAVLIFLFNHRIAGAYTSDAAVAAVAAHLLLFAALFQLPDAVQVSTSCAIRAYKVTRPPMVIHMTAFWGICLPLGVLLGLAPGWLPWHPVQAMAAQGFWIALVVGLSIAAVGLVWLLDRLSLQWLHAASAAR